MDAASADLLTPLHDQMPPPNAGGRKRKVKKTEKARALEQNSDSDIGKKARGRKFKKRRVARVKGVPQARGNSSSDESQGGDDEAGGKIEFVFLFIPLAHHANTH